MASVTPLGGIGDSFGLARGFGQFLCAQHLAMCTVAAYFRTRQNDFKTEMPMDLLPHFLQEIPKKFLDPATPETDDVRMFLLQTRLVVVLVSAVMHQIQLIHQPARFEELQRAVHGDAVKFGVDFLGQLIEPLGIQMLARFVDQIK